jgi:hypothetical protein
MPAYKLEYTGRTVGMSGNERNSKTMEIGAVKGDKVYVLEYSTLPALYYDLLPSIEQVISSLEINGNMQKLDEVNEGGNFSTYEKYYLQYKNAVSRRLESI